MKIEVTLEELKNLIRGDKDKIELFGKEYTLSDQDRVIFKWVLDYRDDNNQDTYANTLTTMLGILGGVVGFNKSIVEYNVPQERIEQYMSNVSDQVMELLNKCLTNYKPIITREQAKQYQNSIKNILEEENKRYEAKQQEILRSNPNSFPRKEEQQWQRFVEEHLQKQLEESNQQEIFNALTQGNNEGFYSKPSRLVNNLEEVDSFDLFIQSEPFEYYRGIFDEFTTPKVIEDRMQSSNYVVPNKCAFNAYKEYCNKHDLKLLECDGTENEQSSRFHARLIAFFRDKGWYFINNNGMDMDKVLNNFKNMNPVIFKLGSNNPCYYGFRLKEIK